MKRLLLISTLILFAIAGANTQTAQGMRIPRLTTAERDQIQKEGDPNNILAEGQIIFNINIKCLEYWNGNKWVSLCRR